MSETKKRSHQKTALWIAFIAAIVPLIIWFLNEYSATSVSIQIMQDPRDSDRKRMEVKASNTDSKNVEIERVFILGTDGQETWSALEVTKEADGTFRTHVTWKKERLSENFAQVGVTVGGEVLIFESDLRNSSSWMRLSPQSD